MNKAILIILWLGAYMLMGCGVYGEEPPKPTAETQDLQKISRSVYRVFALNSQTRSIATGSGFFIEEKGLLLTNYHVIEGRDTFAIFILNEAGNNASLAEATPVACDRKNDLALLRVEGDSLPVPFKLSEKDPQLLQKVIAVGFPGGVDVIKPPLRRENPVDMLAGGIDNLIPNVTQGSVSKITEDVIVHDCKIGLGSSGGPLLDATTGEVVGVNFAGQTDQAYVTFFFAIPAHKIRAFLSGETGQFFAPSHRQVKGNPQPSGRSVAANTSSAALDDDLVSFIVQEHLKGGTEYRTVRRDLYEDILCYYGTEPRVMSLAEYVQDSLVYSQNWPQRVYEIVSVSREGRRISIILKFRCRSRKGRVATGFSHLCLSLSGNLKIEAVAEGITPRQPADFPQFSPVKYRGKRVFSTR